MYQSTQTKFEKRLEGSIKTHNEGTFACRAVFKEDTMATALGEGIKMYVLDLSGEEKYFPIDKQAYEVGY